MELISGLLTKKRWPIVAIAFSALMLASAWSFQIFGKMLPCPLCLRQREIYWIILGVTSFGLFLAKSRQNDAVLTLVNVFLLLTLIVGAGIAGYHAGVEWKLWAGPADCTAGAGDLPTAGRIALDKSFSTISCSEAPWSMFGISMAGYNAVISAGLAAITGFVLLRKS